jgi:hypothetical protein
MDHRATWAMIDDHERRHKQWMEAELEVCVQRVTKLVQDHVLQLEAEEITRNESDGSGSTVKLLAVTIFMFLLCCSKILISLKRGITLLNNLVHIGRWD